MFLQQIPKTLKRIPVPISALEEIAYRRNLSTANVAARILAFFPLLEATSRSNQLLVLDNNTTRVEIGLFENWNTFIHKLYPQGQPDFLKRVHRYKNLVITDDIFEKLFHIAYIHTVFPSDVVTQIWNLLFVLEYEITFNDAQIIHIEQDNIFSFSFF